MPKENSFSAYPIRFASILKQIIWGGKLMNKSLNRNNPDIYPPVAESWEVVDREGDRSTVTNGSLKGKTIEDLRKEFGHEIFGSQINLNENFPLLIKIIDAGDDLSLQVHPNEETIKYFEGSEPKTEMWFVLDNEENASILAGFSKKISKEEFKERLLSNNLDGYINDYKSKKGQSFFIKAGTIHAIMKGNLILEIQQNSNTTFRVSDWNRVDKNGNKREIHVEESLKCINFEPSNHLQEVKTDTKTSQFNVDIIPANPFFKVMLNELYEENTVELKNRYEILTVTEGKIMVSVNGNEEVLQKGETVLVPYNSAYKVTPLVMGSKYLSYYNL